ncbi:MAG: DUF4469 domain-containing protein [Dysgonamonadaceae bacterium]|jgi:hypothetical protein|nr:DUF4469 domain-containing protein [Dysgonamonadaceae bacterium]
MANILHRIKAYLYDNPLTKDDANDYVARVSSEQSLNVRQVAESAVARGGADTTVAAMEHNVNLWLQEMGFLLCDGFTITTEWFTVTVHIRGVFNSSQEHFDPEKHTVLFEFHQGSRLRRELSSVQIDVLGVADSGIFIAQVEDVKTGSVNDLLTPGRNLKITGQKIRIAGEKAGVGIRFRSEDDPNAVYPVASEDIVINNPSELLIVIPALPAGAYRLEISTQFSAGKQQLNEPRTAVFDKILEAH